MARLEHQGDETFIPDEIDRLSTQVGRQAHELMSRTRQGRRQHARIVRLGNAIRKHAEGECDCPNDRTCLMRLYRLIPLAERRRGGKAQKAKGRR